MSNPHPLKIELIDWAQNPDKYQWMFYFESRDEWVNCNVSDALDYHADGTPVRLVTKRSLIPADLLPEGWEVERTGDPEWPYRVSRPDRASSVYGVDQPVGELLRHIDPEAKS